MTNAFPRSQLEVVIRLTKIALVVIISFSILLIPHTKVSASEIFSDNFDDGNADDWSVIGSPGWYVSGGQYGILLNPGVSNSLPSIWDPSKTSISYEVDITGKQGEDRNILIKFKDASNFLEVHTNSSGIYLDKASSSGGGGVQGFSNLTLSNNVQYHFKIEVRDNENIKVFLNGSLIIDANESVPLITDWRPGLRAGTGGTPITEVWFDNIVISDLTETSPSPSPLGVADIKQYDPLWASQIYDGATSWSINPTIQAWGCALTSAAMILDYHGHISDPASLNNWLNNQPDGFLRNGLINWLAVSRYSLENASPFSPALEFSRFGKDNDILQNEIANERPVIVKVPGHFAVVKGKEADDYLVNDPASTDTLLSQVETNHDGSYTDIYSYKPSSTDLSYIMLILDNQVDLKVYDPYGNEILGHNIIEGPLVNDIGGIENSGDMLNIFMFPKPAYGNYFARLSSENSSNYHLDAYLYNSLGEVETSFFDGIINSAHNDFFQITIGVGNQTERIVSTSSIIEDLEALYEQGLISKKSAYIKIRQLLKISNLFIDRGKTFQAKRILKYIKTYINRKSPEIIDPGASNYLISLLNELINSL